MPSLSVANHYDSPVVTINEDELKRFVRFTSTEQSPIVYLHSFHEPNALTCICLPRSNPGFSVPSRNIFNDQASQAFAKPTPFADAFGVLDVRSRIPHDQ